MPGVTRRLFTLFGLACAMLATAARDDWAGSVLLSVAQADEFSDQDALATSFYEQQQWPEAARVWSELLERFPDDQRGAVSGFFCGEALLQAGQMPRALTYYRNCAQRWPSGPHAIEVAYRIAEIHYLQRDFAQAKPALEQFIADHSEHALTHFALTYLGEIELESQQLAQARRSFEQGLKVNPAGALAERCRFGLARALEALAHEQMAQGQNAQESSLEASELYDEAVRFYEFVAYQGNSDLFDEALLNLAILQTHLGNTAQASRAIERLVDPQLAAPLAVRGFYLRGRLHAEAGQGAEAIEALRAGLALTNHNDTLARSGLQFELALQLAAVASQQAEAMPQEAIDLWSDLANDASTGEFAEEATLRLIEYRFRTEEWTAVIELGERLLQPDSPRATSKHVSLQIVREYVGRANLELKAFEAAITSLAPALPRDDHGQIDWSAIDDQQLTVPYLYGLALLRSGQSREAIELFEPLLKRAQTDSLRAGVLLSLVNAYELQSDRDPSHDRILLDHTKAYLDQFADAPDSALVHSARCQAQARLRQWEEADRSLTLYLSRQGDHRLVGKTIGAMAQAAHAAQAPTWAQRWTELLAQQSPAGSDRWSSYLQLAEIAVAAGRWTDAAKWWRRIIDQAPQDPAAAQAALLLARHCEERGDLAEAASLYRSALASTADSPATDAACIALASLLLREPRLGKGEELIANLTAMAQRRDEPLADQALYQLAWIYRAREDWDQSEQLFEQLVATFPNSSYCHDAAYRLADGALRQRDVKGARHWYEWLTTHSASLPSTNDSVSTWKERVALLEIQLLAVEADWEALEPTSRRFLDAYPESTWTGLVRFWLAESLYRLNQTASAQDQLKSLWDEHQTTSPSWLPMVALRLGQVAALQQDWDSAITWGETAREKFPEFRQAYEVDYLLGRCRSARGEFRLAREEFGRVVRSPLGAQTETAAMAQWMIGESYFHQQAYAEAIEAYQRVKTVYPFPQWQAAALLQAAKCYEQRSDSRQAVTLYAQLLRDHADTLYASEASKRLAALNAPSAPIARGDSERIAR